MKNLIKSSKNRNGRRKIKPIEQMSDGRKGCWKVMETIFTLMED